MSSAVYLCCEWLDILKWRCDWLVSWMSSDELMINGVWSMVYQRKLLSLARSTWSCNCVSTVIEVGSHACLYFAPTQITELYEFVIFASLMGAYYIMWAQPSPVPHSPTLTG